ncbi:hypothetical protein Tco_0316124 [Tanacetum coccineum]
MGDANPICTLRHYSKPRHEGYRNTIELPEGNNVVPLRSDTIWIHHHMGGSYYSFPYSILPTGKDCKTPQRYPDVPTTSRRISLRSMDSFQGLTPKIPSSWHRYLALKDLTLYDNENWNDPRDFAMSVKAISLPQDVPSTSDRRLIELENQVQRLMEAHLAPMQPTQVNKITSSYQYNQVRGSRDDYGKGRGFEEETEEEIKEDEEDSPKHFDTFPNMKELSYECDFMVLEDTISVIDHDLGLVVFRKPFVEVIFDEKKLGSS